MSTAFAEGPLSPGSHLELVPLCQLPSHAGVLPYSRAGCPQPSPGPAVPRLPSSFPPPFARSRKEQSALASTPPFSHDARVPSGQSCPLALLNRCAVRSKAASVSTTPAGAPPCAVCPAVQGVSLCTGCPIAPCLKAAPGAFSSSHFCCFPLPCICRLLSPHRCLCVMSSKALLSNGQMCTLDPCCLREQGLGHTVWCSGDR